MIYTVTFNPSLDYVVKMHGLEPGRVNRTESEEIYPGGKGINVSIVLKNLGFDSQPLGFSAGFTGREIEGLLEECGCMPDFIPISEGLSRINVKIKAGEETEINGQGPDIMPCHLEQLYVKLDTLTKHDILVLAGSIPNTLPEDVYEKIMARLDGRGIRVVVDATRDLLLNVLKYHPFLIKPNNHELAEMFGVELHSNDDVAAYAKKLQEMGACNVLVSMAGDGAILIDENGNRHESLPPKGKVVNSVGAGDSMVAGFLAGYLKTRDYGYAFQMGLCTGSASAFQEWLAQSGDVMSLMNKL